MSRELTVNGEKFTAEVTWLAKMPAIGPETAVIQITTLVGAIALRRTCFDWYQESVIPAEGVDQSSMLVDAGKLMAALKTVDGALSITVAPSELVIQARGRTVRLRGATLDFPKWPRFEAVTPRQTVATREIAEVLTSVGTDEAIPQLMAVAFDNGSMVATDRFRLTAVEYAESGFTGKVGSSVLKTVAKNDSVVFIESGRCYGERIDWVSLQDGARTVLAPTLDTEFPQWRRLIPDAAPVRLALDRAALRKAITGEEVTLTARRGGTVTVVGKSGDGVMEIQQSVPAFRVLRFDTDETTRSGDFSVSIRSKYVLDCLKAITSGLVLVEMGTPDKPVVFRDVSEKDVHLVMPMKRAG